MPVHDPSALQPVTVPLTIARPVLFSTLADMLVRQILRGECPQGRGAAPLLENVWTASRFLVPTRIPARPGAARFSTAWLPLRFGTVPPVELFGTSGKCWRAHLWVCFANPCAPLLGRPAARASLGTALTRHRGGFRPDAQTPLGLIPGTPAGFLSPDCFCVTRFFFPVAVIRGAMPDPTDDGNRQTCRAWCAAAPRLPPSPERRAFVRYRSHDRRPEG